MRLWSLLAAQPAVERITLHRPTIELSVDAQGRRSWDSTDVRSRRSRSLPATDSTQAQQPSGEPTSATEPGKRRSSPSSAAGASGCSTALSAIVTMARDRIPKSKRSTSPWRRTATTHRKGSTVRWPCAARSSPSRQRFRQSRARSPINRRGLRYKVSGAPFEGTYQGTLSLAAGISLDGTLKLQAASARALGDWFGRPLAVNGDADAVAFSD